MRGWIEGSVKDLHAKLDGHSKKHEEAMKRHDDAAKKLQGLPSHDDLMKGVHGLLAEHMGDHSGKIMGCINKLPLPPDEKILLQAIENMQEASLGQTLESIEKVRKALPDQSAMRGWIEGSVKDLHAKLDGHSKKHEEAMKRHDDAAKKLQGMPSHDDLMKGVHGLLAEH